MDPVAHELLGILWLLTPLLGAAGLHGLIIKYDSLAFLKRPIDRGWCWRGRRLFGANKTWRGIVAVSLGCSLVVGVQATWLHQVSALRAIELFDYGTINGWAFGALVGLVAELSELPNSLAKRQLDIAPGAQGKGILGMLFQVLDQVDLLLGFWLAHALVMTVTPEQVLVSLLVALMIHPMLTVIGYVGGGHGGKLRRKAEAFVLCALSAHIALDLAGTEKPSDFGHRLTGTMRMRTRTGIGSAMGRSPGSAGVGLWSKERATKVRIPSAVDPLF